MKVFLYTFFKGKFEENEAMIDGEGLFWDTKRASIYDPATGLKIKSIQVSMNEGVVVYDSRVWFKEKNTEAAVEAFIKLRHNLISQCEERIDSYNNEIHYLEKLNTLS